MSLELKAPGEKPCDQCGFIGGYHVQMLHRRSKSHLSSRGAIYERDDYVCRACGLQMGPGHPSLTLDHWVPRSKGGTNTPDNLVTMCRPCNGAKADRLPLLPLASRARGE